MAAVPATEATRAKFVQADPVHRSTSTAVCAIVPFVHLNAIDLRPLAALSAAGACGVAPVTAIVLVVVLDAPPLSVTVSDAV
jgi:hypothetical protein